MPELRYRNFCFTSFKTNLLEDLDLNQFKYIICQKEICPETKQEHIQGYVELKDKWSMAKIKDVFKDPAMHIEKRCGTAEQAANYCKKSETSIPGSLVEVGSRSGQRISETSKLVDLIKQKRTNRELIDEVPVAYTRCFRAVDRIRFDIDQEKAKRWRDLEVHVLYGATGVGKTRFVFGQGELFKLDPANKVWWDGYAGEDILLIDDFYGWIQYGALLNLLDGYTLRLDVKGSFTWANWTKVYITSNRHPREWYRHGLLPALARRIHYITRCDGPNPETDWTNEEVLPTHCDGRTMPWDYKQERDFTPYSDMNPSHIDWQ